MDIVCFDTQQAMEFLVKHILNVKNVPYRKTHNIGELLALLQSSGFVFEDAENAMLMADTIISWETGSRYGNGVLTTVTIIKKVFSIIDSINNSYKGSIQNLEDMNSS